MEVLSEDVTAASSSVSMGHDQLRRDTKRLDRLEQARCIARHPDRNDRRGVLIRLTEHGHRVIEPRAGWFEPLGYAVGVGS
jgi:hypothetical protein